MGLSALATALHEQLSHPNVVVNPFQWTKFLAGVSLKRDTTIAWMSQDFFKGG